MTNAGNINTDHFNTLQSENKFPKHFTWNLKWFQVNCKNKQVQLNFTNTIVNLK